MYLFYARGNTDSRLICFILSQKYYLPSEPTYIHKFIPTNIFFMVESGRSGTLSFQLQVTL